MGFFSRDSESDRRPSGASDASRPSALVLHSEFADDKEDLGFLQRNLQNKKRVVIAAGVGLAVVACVGVAMATTGGGTDASTGSAQSPVTTSPLPTPSTTAHFAPVGDETSVGSTADGPIVADADPSLILANNMTVVEAALNATSGANSTNATTSLAESISSVDPTTTTAVTTTTAAPETTTAHPTTTATPEPTTTTPPPTTTTPAPTTAKPTTTPKPTDPPTTAAPAGGKPNDNGSGLWGGSIRLVNNLKKTCIYTDKTITYFTTGNGRGDMTTGQAVTLGPFGGGYTVGVQENVFAKCAYAGTCAWDGKSADNYCYNFSVDKTCSTKWNDCPWPAGNPSPAPDGRKRYSISGSIDKDGVCVLSVNHHGSGDCNGGPDCYCSAKF
ncbi:Aste57867_10917 [Aphanomyces stellatus]|uniref:Aste57867_10917 protein n=1 Tax=Aphanomyces stellatus TaxID=120398 RepID=A0A485KS13_9STRA|nr:hypothetical protein As57867_010877 [Aphanomyces stellatus]VFT87785.1 Aste57867_10917 [Aphanomyces stellatus]